MIKTFPLTIKKSLVLENLDFLFLLGLIFFLPLYEAPKNIFWGLYIAAASVRIYQQREFHLTKVDYLIFLWIGLGILSSLMSPFHYKELDGAWDIIRYSLIGLIVYRSNYSKKQVMLLFNMIIISTLIAILIGFVRGPLYGQTFQLMSLGHSNDSAVFIAMALLINVSLLSSVFIINNYNKKLIVAHIISSCILFYFLLETQSRASVFAVVMTLAIAFFLFFRRFKSRKLIFGIALLFGCVLLVSPGVIKKNQILIEDNLFLSAREKVWHTTYVIWKEFPVFGIGPGNSNMVTESFFENQLKVPNFEENRNNYYLPLTHPHNLFLWLLLERGLFGLLSTFLFVFILMRSFLKYHPQSRVDITLQHSMIFLLLVILLNGLFAIVFNKECAILFFTILGLWARKFYRKKT